MQPRLPGPVGGLRLRQQRVLPFAGQRRVGVGVAHFGVLLLTSGRLSGQPRTYGGGPPRRMGSGSPVSPPGCLDLASGLPRLNRSPRSGVMPGSQRAWIRGTDVVPLLERETQLASLAEWAAEARQGDGRLVLIAGEAGVGK